MATTVTITKFDLPYSARLALTAKAVRQALPDSDTTKALHACATTLDTTVKAQAVNLAAVLLDEIDTLIRALAAEARESDNPTALAAVKDADKAATVVRNMLVTKVPDEDRRR